MSTPSAPTLSPFADLTVRVDRPQEVGQTVHGQRRGHSHPGWRRARRGLGGSVHICFGCGPRFETAARTLGWISERLFMGTGAPHPDRVGMRFFTVI